MPVSLLQILLTLVVAVAAIVILTAKYHVHAFFALIIACFIAGIGVQIPFADLIAAMKEGFGNIMRSLGLIIVLGTTLGVLLEHTGSTRVMANYILRKVGIKNAALAMSITGFIVGLPIFCDSGYIVLSGLNKSLAKRTGISLIVMSVSLASGLYAVHCLVPPHPGITAAAGTIGVNIGKLISTGILVAVPGMIVGYVWARYAGKKLEHVVQEEEEVVIKDEGSPSTLKAFLPVVVPIVLIAIQSFFSIEKGNENGFTKFIASLGEPVIALSAGVLLAFNCKRSWKKNIISKLLHDAVEKAGGILIIIGAGGAFGGVLAATHIGEHFKDVNIDGALVLLFPFFIASVLKTAQGSSTVAIITAASIVEPLLPSLSITSETEKILSVLSMGAGSMMISHANDAYFWVITKFSGLEMKAMLKVYSIATALMGIVTLIVVYMLFFILS
jgi:GntP family gluconate:H+ symporter